MANATTLTALTRWVQQVLEQCIRLGPSLSDHLEATFGSTDPSDVFADPTCSESASFLELLFFPDQDVRLEFERRYGDHLFSEQDEAELVRSMDRAAVTAAIQTSDGSPPLKLKVPDFALAAFVSRLNLTWQPPQHLLEMVIGTVAAEEVFTVRARLRQLRLPWHKVQIDLVERFLARFPREEEDYEACFGALSAMLTEVVPSDEPFAFLVSKKYFFFQSLCKAERFERLRQTSNMETLMLQGARVAHGSVAQWRELMHLVDRLCQMLYGQTRFFRPPSELTLEEADRSSDQQIGDLFRMFS